MESISSERNPYEENTMRRPDHREDAKNLSLISVSGVIAFIVTAGLVYAHATMDQPTFPIPDRIVAPLADMGPVSGSPRLFGTLVTRRGQSHTGFIRWDRNEGSWSDLLDADKLARRGSTTQSGIRFGHIHRIEVINGQKALFTLKSGNQVEMGARATDLGTGLRALLVNEPGGASHEFQWRDMESVEFQPAPEALTPSEARVFGTLTTRSGMEFTGYVSWDVDEIYTTDVLDGEQGRIDREIPFGSIASIQTRGSRGALVTLVDGQVMDLSGSNDVNSSNGGISVSDATLGQVLVQWEELDAVRFHQADAEPGYGFFDGGHPLRGTVVTESGAELSGEIAWDNDEAYSWEMLNGEAGDVEFQIEFGQIARIQKTRRGSLVELKDGRVFELSGSNDVDVGNRGITIRTADGVHEVGWRDFRELLFEG